MPVSEVFELPIGELEIFAPSKKAHLIGARFLNAETGDHLGPLHWKMIRIQL